MSGIFFLFLFLTVFPSIVLQSNICRRKADDVLFPDTRNCNKYLKCQDQISVSQQCPEGQVFDQELMKCDDMAEYPCSADHSNPTLIGSPCPRAMEELMRASVTYCDKYLLCLRGKYHSIDCPKGRIFSEKTYKCIFPTNQCIPARITKRYQSDDPTQTYKGKNSPYAGICKGKVRENVTEPLHCNRYIFCDQDRKNRRNPNGIVKLGTCAAGRLYHPDSGKCRHPNLVKCGIRWKDSDKPPKPVLVKTPPKKEDSETKAEPAGRGFDSGTGKEGSSDGKATGRGFDSGTGKEGSSDGKATGRGFDSGTGKEGSSDGKATGQGFDSGTGKEGSSDGKATGRGFDSGTGKDGSSDGKATGRGFDSGTGKEGSSDGKATGRGFDSGTGKEGSSDGKATGRGFDSGTGKEGSSDGKKATGRGFEAPDGSGSGTSSGNDTKPEGTSDRPGTGKAKYQNSGKVGKSGMTPLGYQRPPPPKRKGKKKKLWGARNHPYRY